MRIEEYIKRRGLTTRLVTQKMGVSRQAINAYGKSRRTPTAKTLSNLAKAMTELGAETTVVDLVKVLYDTDIQEGK